MGQALYRKYRSKSLDEVVGQEHITTTLKNALKKGSISHAYLFTGPRGVGKTSIARILAHEINKLPYDDETTHLDIIEIDAASNRRIDEIRELRDKIHNAPTSATYKVYIIDEVHMLTKEAFNALLKTLEEPPAHAVFILATTEAHKVPETIISRTQRFSFKPIESQKVVGHLRKIADQEKITVSDDALALIAEHGGGSFRDSISLLDQLSTAATNIDVEDVQRVLGIAPNSAIINLLEGIWSGQTAQIVAYLEELHQAGYQAAQIARQLGEQLRQRLLGSNTDSPEQDVTLLTELLDVPAAHNPKALLELLILKATLLHAPAPKPVEPKVSPTVVEQTVEAEPSPTVEETPELIPKDLPTPGESDANLWQQVLQAIKRKHNTLYGIARMAVPELQRDELILRFAFPFHQKRLNEDKNLQLISDIIKNQTGKTFVITCIVDKTAVVPVDTPPEPTHSPPPANELETISNIFGPSEVLES